MQDAANSVHVESGAAVAVQIAAMIAVSAEISAAVVIAATTVAAIAVVISTTDSRFRGLLVFDGPFFVNHSYSQSRNRNEFVLFVVDFDVPHLRCFS